MDVIKVRVCQGRDDAGPRRSDGRLKLRGLDRGDDLPGLDGLARGDVVAHDTSKRRANIHA